MVLAGLIGLKWTGIVEREAWCVGAPALGVKSVTTRGERRKRFSGSSIHHAGWYALPVHISGGNAMKCFMQTILDCRGEIQSRESDPIVRRWDHRIRVQEISDCRAHYSDEIEIDAGILTPVVWLFAAGFYRHRQRRWRAIARRLARAA
jgi:hypothetical protein